MGLFTAATVGLGLAQAGTQVAGGIATNNEAKYNASILNKQADAITAQQGMITAQQGLEAYQYNRAIGQTIGTGTARVAKSGLKMSGSPMAVLIDTQTQMELDKSIGQYKLEIQKYNLEANKQYTIAQAEAVKRKGKSALMSGVTNAFSTLLNTGMSFGAGGFDTKYTANIAGKGTVNVAPSNYYLRAGRI
jgi:hypothetical protein